MQAYRLPSEITNERQQISYSKDARSRSFKAEHPRSIMKYVLHPFELQPYE